MQYLDQLLKNAIMGYRFLSSCGVATTHRNTITNELATRWFATATPSQIKAVESVARRYSGETILEAVKRVIYASNIQRLETVDIDQVSPTDPVVNNVTIDDEFCETYKDRAMFNVLRGFCARSLKFKHKSINIDTLREYRELAPYADAFLTIKLLDYSRDKLEWYLMELKDYSKYHAITVLYNSFDEI